MEIRIENIENIKHAAKQFVDNMGRSNVFAFYGKMGAGKTTFIKAVCECMGVEDVITSPPSPSSTNTRQRQPATQSITSTSTE